MAAVAEVPTSDAGADTARFEKFKWFTASAFTGLYFFGVYDQAALPPVAAAIDWTGRFRDDPWGRALRTGVVDQILLYGDESDREVEFERLRRLHRDVKGIGRNGQKFHAYEPDVWNFIIVSAFMALRNSYEPITGEKLTPQDGQDFWDYWRQGSAGLQLSGNGALPVTYDDVCAFYERIVRTQLEETPEIKQAMELLLHSPFPDVLPSVFAPLWPVAGPVVGHVFAVLSFGAAHERVRELTGFHWNRRHDLEFKVLTQGVRLAYRYLPKRFHYTPMAYNRLRYQQMAASYLEAGLASFKPEEKQGKCPF